LYAHLEPYDLRERLKADISVDSKKNGTVTIDVDVSTGWLPFWGKKDLAASTAADIANACARQLDMMSREKSVSQARKTRLYIERVMAANRRVIDSLQNTMQDFQQSNKVVALEEQLTAMAENASMVGAALAQAEIEPWYVRSISPPRRKWRCFKPR
jgi:capsule polysaccharide export protein KpsE/RkpR